MSSAMHGEHELDFDPGSAAGSPPPAADGFDLRIQQTPAPGLVCRDVIREASGDRGWAQLVEASFADFKEAVEDGDTARSTSLDNALAELVLIERGMIAAGSRRGRRALRVARLSLARRLITRHLPQASLSPAMVADLLGVSVRHMHMLFEGTGESFSQTVAAQRIRLSGRLLREAPARPISEVAHACGFESLATFYRVFHATVGMPPASSGRKALNQGPSAPLHSTAKHRLI
jgi:AraC-like DNA-binding protein